METPRYAVLDGFGNVWARGADGKLFTRVTATVFVRERNEMMRNPEYRVVRLDVVVNEKGDEV